MSVFEKKLIKNLDEFKFLKLNQIRWYMITFFLFFVSALAGFLVAWYLITVLSKI